MDRVPLIAGNWKMNKTIEEAQVLAREIRSKVSGLNGVEIVVAPPFTALYPVSIELKGSTIHLAGQDLFWEDRGAYTGEISPLMLKDVGCDYVIIGHSERRHYFGENDEWVNRKIRAAIRAMLKPILCVGETLGQRERGDTSEVIQRQLIEGLKGLSCDEARWLTIAYEPVWAIGTGRTATPGQAEEVHLLIRKVLSELFSAAIADAIRIQYGGSVTPENITALMNEPDVDGVLVGGASLNAESFSRIVRFKEM